MSEQNTAVQVKILDKEYQVNCPPSDQEALIKSARYLDENMRKIKGRGNIHGAEKIAVMAALNMANELLSGESKVQTSQDYAKLRIRTLNDRIEAAIADGKQLKL